MRTMLHTIQPNKPAEAATIIDNCFTTARFTVPAVEHRGFNASPGAMVFFSDTILPIHLIAEILN